MSIYAGILKLILPMLWSQQSAELLFAGDAMMHEGQITASQTADGSHSFSGCFDAVKDYVQSADFAVVNFEASLGGKPYRGYPCFSAPDEYPNALIDAGFDFFLLANNHILDRRDRGLHRTINVLDSLGIPHTGIYHSSAARDSLNPAIVNVKGFSLALLNYTYGTNGIELQGPAVVDYIDLERMRDDVARARQKGAELVTVCIHWGDEYRLLPNDFQKRMADKISALDVDMIIGGHPHVIQPMEMRRKTDGKPQLLVYSLGNFISNMKTDDTRGGAMVRVHLKRDSAGMAHVAAANYALVYVDPDGYRLQPAHSASHHKAPAFRRNAEAIFNKHNKGVDIDSIFHRQ